MTANTSTRKLNVLLTSFERRRPMRAGSLIVTIYGDAIVPRGGSLWLGSLLDMMAGFGVEPGLVRTALSRLLDQCLRQLRSEDGVHNRQGAAHYASRG